MARDEWLDGAAVAPPVDADGRIDGRLYAMAALGLYPIITFQYSSTTLYQAS
jgi:hypothetical protein